MVLFYVANHKKFVARRRQPVPSPSTGLNGPPQEIRNPPQVRGQRIRVANMFSFNIFQHHSFFWINHDFKSYEIRIITFPFWHQWSVHPRRRFSSSAWPPRCSATVGVASTAPPSAPWSAGRLTWTCWSRPPRAWRMVPGITGGAHLAPKRTGFTKKNGAKCKFKNGGFDSGTPQNINKWIKTGSTMGCNKTFGTDKKNHPMLGRYDVKGW